MIELESIKQHFTALGWNTCWFKATILDRFWFEKDRLRTSSFWVEGTVPDLIIIHDMNTYHDPDEGFFEEFPHRQLKGGTADVEMKLVEWIKEVEVKWGLYRL